MHGLRLVVFFTTNWLIIFHELKAFTYKFQVDVCFFRSFLKYISVVKLDFLSYHICFVVKKVFPLGKNPIGCKWVFAVKYNDDGYVHCYKARLVATACTQVTFDNEDFGFTGIPVAHMPFI